MKLDGESVSYRIYINNSLFFKSPHPYKQKDSLTSLFNSFSGILSITSQVVTHTGSTVSQ